MANLKDRIRAGLALIKSLQTCLLLITGLAGYMSVRCPVTTWQTLAGVAASLFLAISGSTILNMVYDRDIDLKMSRTCQRPLPSGVVSPRAATGLGVVLAVLGVSWALAMQLQYGVIVLAGLLLDFGVYTVWLKRRTPWSIIWGGLAGGMPILAGRTLGIGQVDLIGLLLAAAVLLWIPTHIMTFSIRCQSDYRAAGVPTFPSDYGVAATRLIITLSSIGAALAMAFASFLLGINGGPLQILGVLTAGLLGLAIICLFRPSERLNFGLFKYASVYMLSSMLLIASVAI